MKIYSLKRSLLILLVIVALPFSSHAASAGEAGEFVQAIVDNTISLIKSDMDATEKEQKLTQVFLDSVDTKWMARFVLGRHWRSTDSAQRTQYHELYQKFLVMSYVPRFREYTDQNIELRSTRSLASLDCFSDLPSFGTALRRRPLFVCLISLTRMFSRRNFCRASRAVSASTMPFLISPPGAKALYSKIGIVGAWELGIRSDPAA